MCGIGRLFRGGGGGDGEAKSLALKAMQEANAARAAQDSAAAAIASANLDTESSRAASENRLRKAAGARGFASSIHVGSAPSGSVGMKLLFGG